MKKASLILVFLFLTALLAGCGTSKALEDKLNNLTEQLKLLENRVAALEAENSALKAQLFNDPHISDAFAPEAEFMFADWTAEDGILTVSGGFARVSGLDLGGGNIAEIHTCDLVLYWGGMELFKDALILHPGEAIDSFELELDTLRYHLPDLSEGDQIELMLEVTLSTGAALTAWGGSWEYTDGQLIMIAG